MKPVFDRPKIKVRIRAHVDVRPVIIFVIILSSLVLLVNGISSGF